MARSPRETPYNTSADTSILPFLAHVGQIILTLAMFNIPILFN